MKNQLQRKTIIFVDNKLNIFYQNVCGITNKKHELGLYLQNLPNDQHYVCISEHFLNASSAPLFSMDEYNLATINVRSKKIRGGSLILSHRNIQYEELIICKKWYKVECFEVCGIVDCETNVNIICCYRTPNDINLELFFQKLEQVLEYFFNKKCVICGDFNINLLKQDKKSQEFLSLLTCYNFKGLINSVTFIRNNAESCLDNIITNIPDNCISGTLVDHNGLADGHAGLLVSLAVKGGDITIGARNNHIWKEVRKFSRKGNMEFRQKFLAENWTDIGVNSFIAKFYRIFGECFIKKRKKIEMSKSNKIKWITKGIKVSSNMKRILTTGKKSNSESTDSYTKKYVNIYRRVIRNARKIAVQREIKQAKDSSKEIWKVVNKHRNKNIGRPVDNLLIKNQGADGRSEIVNDPNAVCDLFLERFNHGRDMVNTGNDALSVLRSHIKRVGNDMIFEEVNPQEVVVMVKQLKSKPSSGYDDIPITVVKDNIDILAGSLASFLNQCVNNSVFPEQYKTAKVIPVYKKGSKTDLKNYRPISLLPTVSKLLEKVMKDRLDRHLYLNKIINERQFGYQKSRGTNEAISNLIADVVGQLSNKKKVAGVLLDLSSAFDMVNHDILLSKLEHYGVRGSSLALFSSYLRNRKYFVQIQWTQDAQVKTYRSRVASVFKGVPQGSLLGPTFFIMFINDLIQYTLSKVPSTSLVIFADDTNAVVSGNNISELNDRVNYTLRTFTDWFDINNLKLNASKTNVILFRTTSKDKDTLQISAEGSAITQVDSVKFLGVYIDSYLNWKPEVAAVINSINSACYALRSLRDD
jgi:hypothetical protein